MNYLQKFKDYLYLAQGLRESTANMYVSRVNLALKSINKEPTQIQEQDIYNFIAELKLKRISNGTQRLYIIVLNSFFKFLNKSFKMPNIMTHIKPPKAETKVPYIMRKEDVEAMIIAVGISSPLSLRNAAIICILADTGIRVSELVSLRFGHIKKDKKQLILNVPEKGNKTYSGRQIPFCFFEEGGLVAEYFLAYYTYILKKGFTAQDYLFQTDPFYWKKTESGFEPGKMKPCGQHQLSRQSIFYLIRSTAKKANLGFQPSPHSFRHFYATYLAVNGLDIHKIKQRLGHSSLERTQIYIHYADIVDNDSAKNNPLSGMKSGFTGFTKIIKGDF